MPNLPRRIAGSALCVLLSACVEGQKPCVDAAVAAGGARNSAVVASLKTCGNPGTNPDALIEDFEDGNNQLINFEGRDGYWWTHHDPNGSTIEPGKVEPEEGGPSGAGKALHVSGRTSSESGAYGSSVGVNLSNSGLYDAAKYAGISFKARVGDGSTKNVRFKIGDVNTHGQLGTCAACWNHFGKDLELSNDWKEYRILFAETAQVSGWGSPRPKNLSPEKLASLDWSIAPGGAFDLWIDDVEFLTCP